MLESFYHAQKEFPKPKLFFVSKSGFTPQAAKFARKNKIELVSS